jgi:hypothetical protein
MPIQKQSKQKYFLRAKRRKEMSSSAKSMLIFGIYLVGLGTFLVLTPNILLSLVGVPITNEVWIRIVGMLILFLAFFYIESARKGFTDYFRMTVITRPFVIIFFMVFILLGFVRPVLILFGIIDLVGALWTGWALRMDSKNHKVLIIAAEIFDIRIRL